MEGWVVWSILHGGPIELFSRSCHCSTTCVTKAVVCVILSVWDDAYKRILAANRKA